VQECRLVRQVDGRQNRYLKGLMAFHLENLPMRLSHWARWALRDLATARKVVDVASGENLGSSMSAV
jgi:hypothetical protein